MLFLREKRGAAEEGLIRPVNSRGLWASSERGPLDTPLSEGPPSASVFAAEVAQLDSVADLVDYVSAQTESGSE